MKRDPLIIEELQAIAPGLAHAGADHPQSLPDRYFDDLPAVILSRIREEQEVPAGYFDGLASRIMGRITGSGIKGEADELGTLAPTLAGLDKRMPHAVPEGYFDQLPATLLSGRQKPARVFSINVSRVVRYAAAAVVAGLLFTGAWFLIRTDRSTTDGPELAAAGQKTDSLPESALANYLDQTSSLDELEPDLPSTVKPEDMALLNLDDQKLGEILTTMSDKELTDYVNSDPNGGPNVMKN